MSGTLAAPQIRLRHYQEAAISGVRSRYMRGEDSALVVLPTGCGKTMTALTMASMTIKAGGRVLWLAHRTELVEQPVEAWRTVPGLEAGPAGIVQGSKNEHKASLVCASTQTIGRSPLDNGSKLRAIFSAEPPVKLVVIDEAHHYSSDGKGQFAELVTAIRDVAAESGVEKLRMLGLTATPERADGRAIGELWGGEPASVYTYQQAIDDGYLVPPVEVLDRVPLDEETERAINEARAGGGGGEGGDLSDKALAEIAKALINAGMSAHAAEAMGRFPGRKWIVFCADISQCRDQVAALDEAGFLSAMVTGMTPKAQRRALLRRFKAGKIDALVNCNVLTEGTDLPICDGIVAARPFSSKTLWVQGVGRGLRLHPGKKDCIVLDLVGATEEHSLIHAAGLLASTAATKQPERFTGRLRRKVRAKDGRVFVPPLRLTVDPVEGDDGEVRWFATEILTGDPECPMRVAISPPVEVEYPGDVVDEKRIGADGVRLPDPWKDRARVMAHWLAVPGSAGRAWCCGLRKEDGTVYLVRVSGDGWMTFLVPPKKRNPRAFGPRPMAEGFARALGDDLFRQAGPLVREDAPWRQEPATERQRAAAASSGIAVDGWSKGDFADAMTLNRAGKWWARHGLESCRAALGLSGGEE